MINKIRKAAGKKAKAIMGIDPHEGGYFVWLKDGWIQAGYCATSFNIEEDMSFDDIAHEFCWVAQLTAAQAN